MRSFQQWIPLCLLVFTSPFASAFSNGPLAQRANIPADGGLACTACHNGARTVNPDDLGRLTITTTPYRPGVKQLIHVRLTHTTASRWGFELAARFVSDETKQAGNFTSEPGVIRVTCAPDSTPAPCGGSTEFATHVAASTFAGQREGAEWTIEWTPPSTDVGQIILYAVGNAANNNNLFSGDFIYATNVKIGADGTCTISGKPTIRAVADAGSGRQNFFAMNGIFAIAGTGYHATGGTREPDAADLTNGKFPAELGCLAVEVGGLRAPVIYASPTQLNAQMPTGVPLGTSNVVVILNPGKVNETKSDPTAITLLANAPAFFAFNGTSIAARHPDFSIAADPAVIPGARPVKPGDVVLLYATGLGPTTPVYQAGEVPTVVAPTRETARVTVAGTAAEVAYAGLAPGSISGLYQVNVRIPESTADGNIPVVLTINGQSSQSTATIPVKR